MSHGVSWKGSSFAAQAPHSKASPPLRASVGGEGGDAFGCAKADAKQEAKQNAKQKPKVKGKSGFKSRGKSKRAKQKAKQKAKQRAQFLVTDTQLWNSIWGFKLHLKVRGKHTFRVSESIASLQLTLKCRFKTGMLCSHHMPRSVALAHLYSRS